MPHPRHLSSVPLLDDPETPLADRPPDVRRPRVVREGPVGALECPGCGERLRFGPEPGETIRRPDDVALLLMSEMGALEREELRVVLLTAKNSVMKVVTVYQGNVSASLVRVGELFRDAVRESASGVVVVHNHPSGDPTPSSDDLHLTAEALAAGRLLDIDLLDHLIVGRDTYISLRDRGVAFDRVGHNHEPRPASAAEGGPR